MKVACWIAGLPWGKSAFVAMPHFAAGFLFGGDQRERPFLTPSKTSHSELPVSLLGDQRSLRCRTLLPVSSVGEISALCRFGGHPQRRVLNCWFPFWEISVRSDAALCCRSPTPSPTPLPSPSTPETPTISPRSSPTPSPQSLRRHLRLLRFLRLLMRSGYLQESRDEV